MAYPQFPWRPMLVGITLTLTYASSGVATNLKDVRAGFATDCQVDDMGSSDWLPAATLARVHDCVSNQTEYSSSGNSVAKVYQNWQRRGDHPIKSPAHGGHYVTIYANDIAATTPTQEVLPGITVGSTLVTPIFAIAGNGKVSAGPMLIMEKMEQGFNAPGGDWRYTLIAPDGTVIGDNTGAGKETINFCKHCSGIFADSVFASLLKGEPPRAPLKPQEKQIARPMTDPAPAPVPAKPALLPPPAEYPISQGPKPRPTILPETLDPNAPIADLAEPTTSKKVKKRPSPNSVPDGEETLLDELKTLKRSTPKS